HHQNRQIFALLRIGKKKDVEQQDAAGEQRHHHCWGDREVIRCSEKLAHVHHWTPPACATPGIRSEPRPSGSVPRAFCTPAPKYPGRTRSTISVTGCRKIS